MRVVFLGTNGWYNTEAGNTISILIETEKYYIILDAGDGFYKIDRFITAAKPIYIFLSHFHLDHITGFHTLNKFNFTQGIRIYGQKGLRQLFENIICHPYSIALNKLPYKAEIFEIGEGRHDLGFSVQCLKLFHSVDNFGYRIEIDKKVIAYSGDTGICDNIMALARGVDLFIAECSLKTGQDNPEWPHLNPHTAAKVAKEAGAKKLALTHFNPFLFPLIKDRKTAEKEAREIFPNSFSAEDDLEIIL